MENNRSMTPLEVLKSIEPAELDYQQWLNVGMARTREGERKSGMAEPEDPGRYHPGSQKKWNGFHGHGKPVTGGTIVQYAREQGWMPPMTRDTAMTGMTPYLPRNRHR